MAENVLVCWTLSATTSLTLMPWPFHMVFSTMLSAAEFPLFLAADHNCTIIPSLMEAKMYASFRVRLFVASGIQATTLLAGPCEFSMNRSEEQTTAIRRITQKSTMRRGTDPVHIARRGV